METAHQEPAAVDRTRHRTLRRLLRPRSGRWGLDSAEAVLPGSVSGPTDSGKSSHKGRAPQDPERNAGNRRRRLGSRRPRRLGVGPYRPREQRPRLLYRDCYWGRSCPQCIECVCSPAGWESTPRVFRMQNTERISESSIQMMEVKISRASQAEVPLAADHVDY